MIIGTVGISKYAADALGDVVYIELPALGDEATAEEALGTVESVKSASDVLSPVSGTITSVNEALADTPADLSKDPEDGSWLVKLEATDAATADSLMDEAAYAEYIKGL
jgi:glycine cleavage system H protein